MGVSEILKFWESAQSEVLVYWEDGTLLEATWESIETIKAQFQDFRKVFLWER